MTHFIVIFFITVLWNWTSNISEVCLYIFLWDAYSYPLPIFNWVVFLLLSFKSSTYILIRKSLFDMCFVSLFSWSVLVFSLSNYVFTEENFLILIKYNVLKFSSYITLLILHLKIHQLAWAHLGFCLCFFTYFIVLNFACRSMIYFDLDFLKSVMTVLGFIFWIWTSNCFSTICWKD